MPAWGAVIVAAGSGSRFGGEVPKQFLPVRGRSLVDRAIDSLMGVPGISRIVVVLPPEYRSGGLLWIPPGGVITVSGGPRRQDSVMVGLMALDGQDMVLVHDAARPFAPADLVLRVMEGAEEYGAAVPVLHVRDTVKRVGPDWMVRETVPREGLALSQTPQGFRLDLLMETLTDSGDVTDECLAMELAGHRVRMVEGDPMNIKVTHPNDLHMALMLAGGPGEVRYGTGLDFHPFQEDRPLMLGGLKLAGSDGLSGHSDGDVLLHAVADALLAAARLGDIGTHFPPTDPSLKGADSTVLLRRTVEMVREHHWEVTQVDVTVIGERPMIGPIRGALIGSLASILSVAQETLWIKGTTTNTLGDIGSGRGLGCFALAVLERRTDHPGDHNL